MHALRSRLLPAALAVTALVVTAPAHAQDAAGASSRYTLGDRAAIFNIAGTMRVEATTGRSVEVEVTRRGTESSQLRVETGELRGRQTLRVIYPSDRIRWSGLGRGPCASRPRGSLPGEPKPPAVSLRKMLIRFPDR